MSAIVIIPARYSSTRFPGKPLALLRGMPMIEHVYKNSLRSHLADDVLVATDSETIFETVLSFGGKAVMTSKEHVSGTDRIAEAADLLDADIIVNVQGDEPLIQPEMIDSSISLLDDPDASIGTLSKRITDRGELFDPNTVKVVYDDKGFALYFSRAPIPYYRDLFKPGARLGADVSGLSVFKHIGIYSYRRDVLAAITKIGPSRLETIEKLEQLRALENGYRIKVKEIFVETVGVDTPADLERIEKCLNSSL
jgi:3-deoxy-manno-octulosonate cytidylyltransferase (CMP-KDO synthetase)